MDDFPAGTLLLLLAIAVTIWAVSRYEPRTPEILKWETKPTTTTSVA